MNGWSTDVVAVACILGSAAVSGGATVAALDGAGGSADVSCVSAAVPEATVVVRGGRGAGVVVMSPRIHRASVEGCRTVVVDVDQQVDVRLDRVRVRMDDVQARMEEARARMEEARERMREAQARAAEAEAQVDAKLGEELQERLAQEMKRLERELARLEDVTVR